MKLPASAERLALGRCVATNACDVPVHTQTAVTLVVLTGLWCACVYVCARAYVCGVWSQTGVPDAQA